MMDGRSFVRAMRAPPLRRAAGGSLRAMPSAPVPGAPYTTRASVIGALH